VVLARPIFSPTDFIQIKGRGTRLFTFKHHDGTGERTASKDDFALFDFFANCEFFEKEFDYDQKLKLPNGLPRPGPGGEPEGPEGPGAVKPATFTNTSPDPMAAIVHEAVGVDGMKIDREMYRQRFATQAQEMAARHPELRDAVASENWPAAEALSQKLLFNQPKEFWDILKLRQVFQSDRQPNFREILQFIFGLIPRIATREQLAAEHFERFLSSEAIDATKIRELRHVFHAFVLDGDLRGLIEQGDFAALRARDAGLYQSVKTVGADGLKFIATYIRTEVPLDSFSKVA
jgi:type I restriction enzyme R subunit